MNPGTSNKQAPDLPWRRPGEQSEPVNLGFLVTTTFPCLTHRLTTREEHGTQTAERNVLGHSSATPRTCVRPSTKRPFGAPPLRPEDSHSPLSSEADVSGGGVRTRARLASARESGPGIACRIGPDSWTREATRRPPRLPRPPPLLSWGILCGTGTDEAAGPE